MERLLPDATNGNSTLGSSRASNQQEPKKRKDLGRLHPTRNSLLCRGLLETLRRNGQNLKPLRAMEKALRGALRPTGPLAELIFDKFFASVLRLVLSSQLEQSATMSSDAHVSRAPRLPQLHRRSEPMLSQFANDEMTPVLSDSDTAILHRLSLLGRYDTAANREMYRSLSLLLVLRDEGDPGLVEWAKAAAGIKSKEDR
jgi:hypothetical protein